MDALIEFLKTLNSLSPLAVIALLGIVIFFLVRNQRGQKAIAENHLHGLPELLDLTRAQTETLQRIEVSLAYIKARINGRSE